MLNFAHGDVIMVGAYVSFCTTSYLHLPAWVSVILAVAVCTALGVVIEGLAYRPLRQAHDHVAVGEVEHFGNAVNHGVAQSNDGGSM